MNLWRRRFITLGWIRENAVSPSEEMNLWRERFGKWWICKGAVSLRNVICEDIVSPRDEF